MTIYWYFFGFFKNYWLYLGNMNNPTITRLGSTQLWYKYWYSDSLLATNLQHDKMFHRLVRVYLDYGLSFTKLLFIHDYWYRSRNSSRRINSMLTSSIIRQKRAYDRRFYYENIEMSVTHSYVLRAKTPEYFPTRTWFIKYLSWVIVCVRWYKPWKVKSKKRRFLRSASGVNVLSKPSESYFFAKRLRLLLSWFSARSTSKHIYGF